MGGIEIGTQKSSNDWTTCSISVPMYRNVWYWTEEGFVTAAHCFNNNIGKHIHSIGIGVSFHTNSVMERHNLVPQNMILV